MNHKSFELWQGITVAGHVVEIWHKQTQPGAKTWHLTDFEIRVDGVTVSILPRRSTTAEVFRIWEKLAGVRNAGYPMLPHCPSGGSPHLQDKAGRLYYAPFEGLSAPSIYRLTEHTFDEVKSQGCVCT